MGSANWYESGRIGCNNLLRSIRRRISDVKEHADSVFEKCHVYRRKHILARNKQRHHSGKCWPNKCKSNLIREGVLQVYVDAAEQSVPTHNPVPVSYFSYFSCARLKEVIWGAQCTCGKCVNCKPKVATVKTKVEFLIHVPTLQRTAEQLLAWFSTQIEGPFLEETQWKTLLVDTFGTQLEIKLFKMYLKNGRNARK
jgi:hypothetical protein